MPITAGKWNTGGSVPGQVWSESHGLTVAFAVESTHHKVGQVSHEEMLANAISLIPELVEFIKNVATNPRPWDQEAQALLKELESSE